MNLNRHGGQTFEFETRIFLKLSTNKFKYILLIIYTII